MRRFATFFLASILFLSCKKENSAKVEVYLLQSFSRTVNTASNPATINISNAVLAEDPIIADGDIAYYDLTSTTFHLKKDIKALIKDYGPDKAFAVTVNKEPVFYGQFHPAYLSSIAFGIATIDPVIMNAKELTLNFATLQGSATLQQLDKRRDDRLLSALRSSGRLR